MEQTNYTQVFIVTMQTGNIGMVFVSENTPEAGELAAKKLARAELGGRVWDICSYPVSTDDTSIDLMGNIPRVDQLL